MLEPYREINQKLESLKLLESDWNSYKAPAIDHRCIAKAQNYLLLLARRGVQPPQGVVPTVFAGAELYWRDEDLSINFNLYHLGRQVEIGADFMSLQEKGGMKLAEQLMSVLGNMQIDEEVECTT